MKQFQYKGEKYQVPTSWDEVTLEQQIKVSEDTKEFKNEITKRIALLSGYAGIPIEVLKKSSPKEVGKLFKYFKFLGEEIPDKPLIEFEHKGHKYNVVQNLLEQEFQDFISLETALQNAENDMYTALPQIIAIIAKRDGETLSDFDPEERAKEFLDLPLPIANGLAVFFYTSVNQYTILSQLYSQPDKVIAMKAKEAEDSLSKLDGSGLLTRLLKGLLRIYVKSLKHRAQKLLRSTQSKSSTPKWKRTFRRFTLKGRSIKRRGDK